MSAKADGPDPGKGRGRRKVPDDVDRQDLKDGTTHRCGSSRQVLSDPEAWALLPSTKQADWCGKLQIRATSHADGRPFTFPARPCGSWTHEDCAKSRANELLGHLKRAWRAEHLHLASFRTDRRAMMRIRKRRQGDDGPWLWVARADGWTHFLSTAPYSGRLEPVLWVQLDPPTAIEITAAAILGLPGVEKFRADFRWKPSLTDADEGKTATRTYTVHGFVGDGLWELAQRQAAEVVCLKYGGSFKPWEDEPPPPEVRVSAWIEELQTTLINLRETSPFPHGRNLTNPPPEDRPKMGKA